MIHYQPFPKVPPIGFFQPISVDPKDMMTDVEFLLGILKKLNQVIKQVNTNTEFIESYAGKIEEIEAKLAELTSEMQQFEDEVNTKIATEFAAIKVELQSMIATTLIQANAYTDSVAAGINARIDDIIVGDITLFDPTTGAIEPLQTVINNLYDVSRTGALTASEYDGLDLSATAYDAYDLTAIEYDQNGKTLLV